MKSPAWLEDAVFYEIYPQSFYDSNGDGIGDLKGIIQKLDYIKDLGFNAIWLNPIFKSTFWDAGYDISDYYHVDKRYGTHKTLSSLIDECHKRGIHLLLDLVPGHTSILHPWFKKSALSEDNEFSHRYIWTKDYFNADTQKRWIGGFTKRMGAAMVNFYSIQPALNYGFYEIDHPEYQERIQDKGPQETIQSMIDVIEFYLAMGVDGFRVDMAGWLVKNDPEGKGTIQVWKQIFSKVRSKYPLASFVSEWNCPCQSMEAGFDMDFLLQDPFTKTNHLLSRTDNAFFRFHKKNSSTSVFMEDFQKQLNYASTKGHYLSLISDNHDNPRISHYLSYDELKFYYAFLLTMPNVPFFYYGDEIAMPYIEEMESVEGGYQRTGSRVPMYWDKRKKNAGFTVAKKALIPVKGYKKSKDVVSETKDPNSLLHVLKELISVKKNHPALKNNHRFLLLQNGNDESPLVYLCISLDQKERILVAFNTGETNSIFSYPLGNSTVLYSLGYVQIEKNRLILSKQSFVILKVD